MSNVVKLLQITDPHLGANVGETLLGMDTDASLSAVIEHVLTSGQAPDLVLGTGDIALRGDVSAYQRFQAYMKSFDAPCVWIPGNHDVQQTMLEVGGNEWMPRYVELEDWVIVLLNSAVVGEETGLLAASELDAGIAALEQFPNHHALICVHHHVLPVGSGWLDEQRLSNADELLQRLKTLTHVRGILSGHVHQSFEKTFNDVKVITTPSTCIQFEPNSSDFGLDDTRPGYRWLTLHANGHIETRVERIAIDLPFDKASSGYR